MQTSENGARIPSRAPTFPIRTVLSGSYLSFLYRNWCLRTICSSLTVIVVTVAHHGGCGDDTEDSPTEPAGGGCEKCLGRRRIVSFWHWKNSFGWLRLNPTAV